MACTSNHGLREQRRGHRNHGHARCGCPGAAHGPHGHRGAIPRSRSPGPIPATPPSFFYEYQQKEGSAAFGDWTTIPDSSATTTSFRLTGLNNGTAYSYRVRARTSVEPSPATDAVTATPRGFAARRARAHGHPAPRRRHPELAQSSRRQHPERWQYQYKVGAGVYQPWQDRTGAKRGGMRSASSPRAGLCLPPSPAIPAAPPCSLRWAA